MWPPFPAKQNWLAVLICSPVIFFIYLFFSQCTAQIPTNSLVAWNMTIIQIVSQRRAQFHSVSLCCPLFSFLSVCRTASASLISQIWLCSLMVWFSFPDSYHLPCCGRVRIIVTKWPKKETELLVFLYPFPGSLCDLADLIPEAHV